MKDLKLIALDAADLGVMSAHLQDAVVVVGDMAYQPRQKRFVAIANRFDWADALEAIPGADKGFVRHHAAIRFERVLKAQLQGVDLEAKRQALELLAIRFEVKGPSAGPEGFVTLVFAGGGQIRLHVECIEAELRDLGTVWTARHKPEHPPENPDDEPAAAV